MLRVTALVFTSSLLAVIAGWSEVACLNGEPANGTPTSDSGLPAGEGGPLVSEEGGDGEGGSGCPPAFIDKMQTSAGPTTTGGYWYSYSDRTCVSFEPAEIKPDAAGTLSPLEGEQFLAVDDGTGPLPPCEAVPVPFRDFFGKGETTWGAGMGFDFVDLPTQADPYGACPNPESCTGMRAPDAYVPMAGGDAGGGPTFAAPFDVTAPANGGPHRGISFWGRAPDATAPVDVDVQLSDKHTNPGGQVCAACLYGGNATAAGQIRCADDWIETTPFTASWKPFKIDFDDPALTTKGWSTMPNKALPSSAMDRTSLFYVHFQISTSNGAALKPFHIQVAYVTWVD